MSLEVTNFSAGYGKEPVVSDVSFTLEDGTLTALLGANGCGKTTLLKGLCHLIPFSGDCVLRQDAVTGDKRLAQRDAATDGERFAQRGAATGAHSPVAQSAPLALHSLSSRQIARHISYIPQRSGVSLSLPVVEIVLMGFFPFLPLLSSPGRAQRDAALLALERVGMRDYAERDFLTLSEGQKQLCILARTLVQDTEILLLDEPDSALDYPNRNLVLNILEKIVTTENKAGLLVLHDPCMALDYCSRLLLMKEGRIIGSLSPADDSEALMSEALSELYGPVRVFRLDGHLFLYQEKGGGHAAHDSRFSL